MKNFIKMSSGIGKDNVNHDSQTNDISIDLKQLSKMNIRDKYSYIINLILKNNFSDDIIVDILNHLERNNDELISKIDYKSEDDDTLLMYAVVYKRSDIVIKLLDLSASPHTYDNYGRNIYNKSGIFHLNSKALERLLGFEKRSCEPSSLRIYNNNEFSFSYEIGYGSYGSVYRAKRLSDDKDFVVKCFLHGISYDKSFIREVNILKMLNQKFPNQQFVSIQGIIFDKKHVKLVLEPVDMNVEIYIKLIDKLPDKQERMDHLLNNLILGVYNFHSIGFIHNDLKKDNILVNSDGSVRFIDAGISEYLGISPARKTVQQMKTTINIESFDCNECIVILKKGNRQQYYSINLHRKSFCSDVFSLGNTIILGMIFQKTDAHFSCIYISVDGVIYYSFVDTENIRLEFDELTDEDINKINSYGNGLYDLLAKMVDINPCKRSTCKQLLGFSRISSKVPVILAESSGNISLIDIFRTFNYMYSNVEIENHSYELDYFTEIIDTYSDQVITCSRGILDDPGKYINGTILILVKYNIPSFDILFNVLLYMSKYVYQSDNLLNIDIVIIINYFSILALIPENAPDMFEVLKKCDVDLIKFNVNRVNDMYETFIKNESLDIPFRPVMIHIRSISICLSENNVSNNDIANVERYIMSKIINVFLTKETFSFKVSDLVMGLYNQYQYENNHLPIIDSKVERINLMDFTTTYPIIEDFINYN